MNNLINKIEEIKKKKYTTISGLNEVEKYTLPYFFDEKMVIIVPQLEDINNYAMQLKALNKKVIVLQDKIPLLYSFSEKNSQIFKDYYMSLSKIVEEDFDIVLLSVNSLFQKLPTIDFFSNNILNLKIGENQNLSKLQNKLMLMGYNKQDIVSVSGEFSVRGDILDVYPINSNKPIRINFFDTEIESINYFDSASFNNFESINEAKIYCNTFFNNIEENRPNLKHLIKEDLKKLNLDAEAMLRISGIVNTQFEYLDNNMQCLSSVFFLPYCKYFSASILDYFSKEIKIIIDEPKLVLDFIYKTENENISSFLELSLKGEFLPTSMQFYFKEDEILNNLKTFNLIAYARLISQNKLFESEHIFNFICSQNLKFHNKFVELTKICKEKLKNEFTILLCCGCALTLNKVKTFFDEGNLKYNEINDIVKIKKGINLTLQNIPYSSNFDMEKFLIIGSYDLNSKQIFASNNLSSLEYNKPKFLPKVGDYVVHEIHGIGKCLGIKNLKITSVKKDYIVVEYKDGDILYLPCENADSLSAFVGESEPKCNKIGGTEFFKVKQKIKNSIKEMAFDLIKVYSERLSLKGFKYSSDSYLQQEFENAFPYSYTQDQINAISEIKKDMESGKIMDRLLCGDVGFGKTEVALVSAYKAIQDGKQVAIICPTTILCEQHFNTALARMKNFMVNIAEINRFKTKQEQEKILKDLCDGKIDLICGTHRLFSSDVKFKDLGLIILDEEQRFGVEDKERLKNIKRNVDVLSLSATPIPRTLYMSLVGIRDVSYLTTPPIDRKKTKTLVIDYSDSLLVDCCKKELERGGQVLIVYNKVETITNFYAHVKSLIPEAKIGFAHGQMSSKELESAIYDLYTQKTQILISTVLIENGIDLPHANTLFVIDSDKLGLSQLYQLRGRIGRSNIDAYAYFSFEKNKILTPDSYKRLDAIMEFSDFGSGYKVALRDLEIRGAGDVLGKLQHGHMQQVGYDMYVKLLNEAVCEIKGEKQETLVETKIDININAYLPETYISSNENRIDFYTKISKIKSIQELNMLLERAKNTFGNVPKPVEELCYIGLIKNLATRLFIKNIKLDEFYCKIVFYDEVKNQKSLYNFLLKPNVDFVLNQENMPIISLRSLNSVEKTQDLLIKLLFLLLENKNNN